MNNDIENETDFEALRAFVLKNPVARVAAVENSLRRGLSEALSSRAKELGHSLRDLAKRIGTSPSQVQRLLHEDVGGSLTLTTICRAADALNMTISIQLTPSAATAEVPGAAELWVELAEVPLPPRVCLDPIESYVKASHEREKAWSSFGPLSSSGNRAA